MAPSPNLSLQVAIMCILIPIDTWLEVFCSSWGMLFFQEGFTYMHARNVHPAHALHADLRFLKPEISDMSRDMLRLYNEEVLGDGKP